ncbi:hypothetical protein IMSAG249_02065 [Lachnospiraceae bacterium]|nr:hypothetical protein IMSAGC009_02960 [Lachnospiraceae bacterium]GFI70236.1 hypothetical protein IMSAG249_02065 [Lachnospiraceae bacterium]
MEKEQKPITIWTVLQIVVGSIVAAVLIICL